MSINAKKINYKNETFLNFLEELLKLQAFQGGAKSIIFLHLQTNLQSRPIALKILAKNCWKIRTLPNRP